jgi:hypothetical protein
MADGQAAPKVRVNFSRPLLYTKQREAIFECKDPSGEIARYGIIEASTKAGKTVGCMAWLLEQALKNIPALRSDGESRNFWWVAPVFAQAKIAWRRMKQGLPQGLYTSNETEMTIRLAGCNSVIWFKSAEKPDNLYGEDVYAAVIDEASRCREEAWTAIRSTLTATRGMVRIIGNVKGRTNWHYKIARRAEQGEQGFSYAKLTANDAVAGGILEAEEIEDAKRLLPEAVFNELYLAIPSDDEGNPFGFKHIAECVIPALSENPPVAIGVDLAKSLDWTVVIGLDKQGMVCGFERWQHVPWDETQKRIMEIIKMVPTLMDSTGVGDPIVEGIQKRRPNVQGFKFTAQSKQRLMEGLAVSIQSRKLGFPDGIIRQELDNFEYAYTRTGAIYTAPEGLHDDCVTALALANEQYRQAFGQIGAVTPGTNFRISPWLISGDDDGGEDET